ncbi:MAG: hypothetical protein CMB36_03450 [Euryarchaeota archaeon]|nr:hypothetical protein [Euryarchaeota archaeon]|tara:strand:+ start:9904 stop:11046 length:1143 start_codon:yes stop_codon:yes gene_type:complete
MLKLTSNIHHIHDVFLHRTFMAGNEKALTTLLVSLLLLTLLPMPSTAQGLPGSISMECSDDPVMDVKPGEYEDETVECTVTNDGSILAESVEISHEWDGVFISMSISEDSFTLEPDESQDFTVTFVGEARLDSEISNEFTITATVTAWGPIPVEGTPLSNVANHSGEITVNKYGQVTLDIPDTSSRNMKTSDEVSITFQVDNDGNAVDTIEIRINNADELEALGFVIQSGAFLSARDVQPDGVSEQLEFIIRAPSDAAEEIRKTIVIEASSTNDDSSDIVDFDLIVEAKQDSAGLGAGLSEVSTDDLALYGAIAGGVLFVIFLLIIIGRVSKRTSKNKTAKETTEEPAIEIEDDDEFDFDLDFDDDEFLADDLDSMLDDL